MYLFVQESAHVESCLNICLMSGPGVIILLVTKEINDSRDTPTERLSGDSLWQAEGGDEDHVMYKREISLWACFKLKIPVKFKYWICSLYFFPGKPQWREERLSNFQPWSLLTGFYTCAQTVPLPLCTWTQTARTGHIEAFKWIVCTLPQQARHTQPKKKWIYFHSVSMSH